MIKTNLFTGSPSHLGLRRYDWHICCNAAWFNLMCLKLNAIEHSYEYTHYEHECESSSFIVSHQSSASSSSSVSGERRSGAGQGHRPLQSGRRSVKGSQALRSSGSTLEHRTILSRFHHFIVTTQHQLTIQCKLTIQPPTTKEPICVKSQQQ